MYLNNLNIAKIWFILGAVGALFVLILVISLISSASKKKSGGVSQADLKKMEENKKAIEEEKQQDAAKRHLKEKVEAHRQALIREEIFARLEAQRKEAEGDEVVATPVEEPAPQEEVKEEVAVAAEEPIKEEPVKEEKPVAKKTTTKKAPAKKVEEKKEEETAVVAEGKPAPKKTTAKKAPAKKVEEKKEETAVAAEEKPAPKKTTAKKAPAKKVEEKKEEKEEAMPVLTDDADTDTLARYAGKWQVFHILTDDNSEDDMYFFELRASNGEKLLSSEEYTSYQGAVRGIETHKTNILKGNFKITLSKKGDYIVKLLSGSGQLLCTGETYATKLRCENAIKSIKRFARTAIVDENVHDFFLKAPKDTDNYVAPVAEGVSGKWIISNREGVDGEKVFYFELFANNGEKLLSSEEYATYAGAVNGIQTHKQNIAKDNFRITLTKKGDYIYKILNGNGQLLCLGEHYKSKARCQSAVDSVKRFADNSPVLTDPNTQTK